MTPFSGVLRTKRRTRSLLHMRRTSRLHPYPRQGGVLLVRRIFLCCWGIIGAYISNAGRNLLQLALNASSFPDMKAILNALAVPFFLLNSLKQFPWITVTFLIPFWPLLVGCIWATADLKRESEWQKDQEVKNPLNVVLVNNADDIKKNEQSLLLPSAPFDMGRLPTTQTFVDRQEHVNWLLEQLRNGRGNDPIVLYGLAGVGKTALVARAVRQLHDEKYFLDGIIVYSCQGQSDVIGMLRKILGRFDPQRRYGDMNDNTLEWNDIASVLLYGKDILVILDNVESSREIEKLLVPLRNAEATILITARHQLIETSVSRKIGPLSSREALALFMQSHGYPPASFTHPQLAAAESIIKELGCHALAVKLAGAQATHRDIELMARELQDPQQGIELPNGETPRAVAVAFEESIKDLPVETQKLFVALAAFPSVDFSRGAAIFLGEKLGLTEAKFDLHRLVMRALIETSVVEHMPLESDRERLRLHPLLRSFAYARFALWSQTEQKAAQQTAAEYYAEYTNKKIPYSALSVDELNITGMLKWAHDHQNHDLETTLCAGMKFYWYHHSCVSDGRNYLRWGVEAAKGLAAKSQLSKDLLREADLRFTYALVMQREGNLDEAEKIYKDDLRMRRQMKDSRGESEALVSLVHIALQRGRLHEVEDYCKQSSNITRSPTVHKEQDRYNESALLGCQSELYWRRGRLEEAEGYSKESLEILQELHESRQAVYCLIRLGSIARDRGRFEAAREYYAKAQYILHEVQDRQAEGWLYRCIGTLAQAMGHTKRAQDYGQQALIITGEMQDQDSEAWVLGDLGVLAHARKAFPEAESYYMKALNTFRRVQDRHGEGWVLGNLGDLAQEQGEDELVEDFYREALKIAREGEDLLNYAKVALALGIYLVVKQGKRPEGCPFLKEAEQIYLRIGLPDEERILKKARSLQCP